MRDAGTKRWLWWVALIGLGVLLAAVGVQKVYSADLWWQARNGEWILQHADVPDKEMYSHTAAGMPLREMRWVYCVVLAKVWQLGDWAPSALQAALVTVIWALIVWPVRRLLASPWVVLAIALGLVAGSARWVMRPELVTYAMVAAYLLILERARTTALLERMSLWGWAIPLLQVIWTNSHTTFVFGPLLCVGFALADTVARVASAPVAVRAGTPPPKAVNGSLWLIAVLSVGACWANPYGHWGAMYAAQMYRETSAGHATQRLITEMRSPLDIPLEAWGWDFYAACLLILLAGGLWGVSAWTAWRASAAGQLQNGRSRAWVLGGVLVRLGMLGLGAYLFTMLQRNTPLTAVLGAWVAVKSVQQLRTQDESPDGRWWPAGTSLASLLTLGVSWFFVTDRYAVARDLPREFGLGIVEWYQPRGAEAFLLEAQPPKNLFNIVRDGSYFIRRVSDHLPVFIDGRTDAYGTEMFEEFAALGPGTFDAAAQKWSLRTAVIPSRGYEDLARHLVASPDWALVHLDPVSLVFVRRSDATRAMIEAHLIDPAKPAPTGAIPEERPTGWRRTIGGVGRPWYTLGMADAYLSVGQPGAAQPFLEEAFVRFPDHPRTRARLAAVREAAGDGPGAQAALAGLPEALAAGARYDAAGYLLAQGKLKEALAPLRAAAAADRHDPRLAETYADVCLQTGDAATAKAEYERLLTLGPATISTVNKLGSACQQAGDAPGAIRAWERSLGTDPQQYIVWNMLGGVYGASGNLQRAEACFERSLRIKPDYGQAQRNLERVRQMKR